MNTRAHGQLRRGQVITTFGPGALVDLPRDSVIVAGLESWNEPHEKIIESRLAAKLALLTGVVEPALVAPPADDPKPGPQSRSIGAYRFPEWFLVQQDAGDYERSRRLVHRRSLENGKFEGKRPVVAVRFVRACSRGHIDDIDWRRFVHRDGEGCSKPLWLDERGTGGDLGDLVVQCECEQHRSLADAKASENFAALGPCLGRRPWLGPHTSEACDQPSRLLIRTASNAYFPQVVSVLSLPQAKKDIDRAVENHWDDLGAVEDAGDLAVFKKKAAVARALAGHSDELVLDAIRARKSGKSDDRPVKEVELDALFSAPEGYDEDSPVDPDFHARRLPASVGAGRHPGIDRVVRLHRLREVMALVGFTRFEPEAPDIHGEYDSDVRRAALAVEPRWFPAVENRGEGVFLALDAGAVAAWRERPAVRERVDQLAAGHEDWCAKRQSKRTFPGGEYVLLHTLSHLLVQSLSLRCGYPASSLRERIYVDTGKHRYGLLLYTGSPDAEGTLGGLVQRARHMDEHLADALRSAGLCSSDPVCAHHEPAKGVEERRLHGAACHGCSLIAETSCEMRNDYLDRALVTPVLGVSGAAFFAERR